VLGDQQSVCKISVIAAVSFFEFSGFRSGALNRRCKSWAWGGSPTRFVMQMARSTIALLVF
jgi:hypothetical protein